MLHSEDSEDEESSSGDEIAPHTKIMHNSRYDEAHELSDSKDIDGSVDSDDSGVNLPDRGDSPPVFGGDSPPMSEDEDDYEFSLGESQDSEIPGGKDELFGEMAKQLAEPDKEDSVQSSSESESQEDISAPRMAQAEAKPSQFVVAENKPYSEEESSSSDEEAAKDNALDTTKRRSAGEYDPKEFVDLEVSEDIKSLFEHITRFTPQEVELKADLKPFIPDYIAAIGELDKFVKIPLPNGGVTPGTAVLDEPCTVQSNETVLQMQLKATSKRAGSQTVAVRSMEASDRASLCIHIQKWIDNVADVQKSKHQIEVHYQKPMPEIEELMQVWPEQVEVALDEISLPRPEMSMTTDEYVRLICSILDIPIYDQKQGTIQSLHVLMTLFMEFLHNPHFNRPDET